MDKKQYRNHVTDAILEKIPEINNIDLNRSMSVINSVMMESAKLCIPQKK